MQIYRMQNELPRAGQAGSVQEMVSKSHSYAVWLDSSEQHVAHPTDGVCLDQVGGRWSQPVKVEIRVNELMCSADQQSCLDRLGPLSARADMLCPCVEPRRARSCAGRGTRHAGFDCRLQTSISRSWSTYLYSSLLSAHSYLQNVCG